MATWTTLPDASLEPGKPIRSIDGLALRDNPVAITEGAAGAPRVQDAALNATVTTAGKEWVSNRIAAQNHQDIGSMTIAWNTSNTTAIAQNETIAGSTLRYTSAGSTSMFGTAGVVGSTSSGSSFPTGNTLALSGTWRNMGGFCSARVVSVASVDSYGIPTAYLSQFFPSLWLRIA